MNKMFIAVALAIVMLSGCVLDKFQSEALLTSSIMPAKDTDITFSQCDHSGSNMLVVCSNAGVMALNNVPADMSGRNANVSANSSAGDKLGVSFSSVAGGCVQDNITGLMWEVKTIDGGLHDMNKTYTNFDSTTAAQKHDFASGALSNPAQAEIDAPSNSVGFKNRVNAQGLCGFSDWRLPTADELQSIVDYSVASPKSTIDARWFPYTRSNYYWSGSPVMGDSDYAWNVDFYNGSMIDGFRNFSAFVRLVRAGQPHISNRYTASVDGQEITDNQTKLIWRRCAEGMVYSRGICKGKARRFTIEAALQLAATQASSTGIAWRLPNIRELASIVDRSRIRPAIDLEAFRPRQPARLFWSASYPDKSWGVDFHHGVVRSGSRAGSGSVRLVRTGQ